MTDLPPAVVDESDDPRDHKSIGEVLSMLQEDFPDVSISKIRFLESRGLIEPRRAPSGYRKFGGSDVDRLRWILTMQRDHFLPLRVIKDRLEQGPIDVIDDGDSGETTPAPAVAPVATPRASRFEPNTGDSEEFDPGELARQAGLSAQQLDQLVQFGLIDAGDDGEFGRDELRIAKAAAGFLQHGIEARHLKAWRVAAEREAGMLEQIVTPLTRKGSPESEARAREVAEDLVDMGNVIREAIIVKSLRDRLGFGAD